ncbi:MAG: peptidase T [Ignavibacteriae bacterium]|nr:peptidase T [Ignavibacteriota bacterium]
MTTSYAQLSTNKETVVERFLRYVKIDTQSDENSSTVPTTQKQFTLARLLVEELHRLGLSDAFVDSFCIVYATLPANVPDALATNIPVIGLLAHMDTSPSVSGSNVNPIIHKNYQGGSIVLPNDSSQILSIEKNPRMKEYINSDIITADGMTLLGADDKAGIAEIMSALEILRDNPSIKHGTLKIAFTPDEETGAGIEKFDVKKFGASYAYTIDGGELGEISNETWSADAATITVHGKSFHPGEAKGLMVNSLYATSYFISHIPEMMRPETTEKREGFLHPYSGTLETEKSTIRILLRDFELSGLEKQRQMLYSLKEETEKKFPGTIIDVDIKPSYRNMKLELDKVPFVIEYALEACKRSGIKPKLTSVRAGTDGSNLTEMGLPCPNIFTGGENFHSKLEWIPVKGMEKTTEMILNLIQVWTENKTK